MLDSWAPAGLTAPRHSQAQAQSGQQIPFAARLPRDMIGYVGHVALYLGRTNGTDYMLESPQSGDVVKVSVVRGVHYPTLARIWTATGSTP